MTPKKTAKIHGNAGNQNAAKVPGEHTVMTAMRLTPAARRHRLMLARAWDCNATEAVERALVEAVRREVERLSGVPLPSSPPASRQIATP